MGGAAGDGAGGLQGLDVGPGRLAREGSQPVNRGRDARLDQWQLGLGYRELSLRLSHDEFGAESGLQSGLREFESFFLAAEVVIQNAQLILKTPQFHIVGGDLGQQGNQDVAPGFLGGIRLGRCRFHETAIFPKHINFPTRIKGQIEKIEGFIALRRPKIPELAELAIGAAQGARHPATHSELRPVIAHRGQPPRAGFANARCSRDQRGISRQRIIDQRIELGVLKTLPPLVQIRGRRARTLAGKTTRHFHRDCRAGECRCQNEREQKLGGLHEGIGSNGFRVRAMGTLPASSHPLTSRSTRKDAKDRPLSFHPLAGTGHFILHLGKRRK